MSAKAPPKAVSVHVAGPPEKEHADTEQEWKWVQRCLRCDRALDANAGFHKAGVKVLEYANGAEIRMTKAEAERAAATSTAPPCKPEPLHPVLVYDEEG